MKKTYLLISIIVLVLLMIAAPPMVKASGSGLITANGTYDLSSYGNGATISINTGLTVTLTNNTGITYTGMKIVCEQGVSLTINNVNINDAADDDCCALSFTGSGNHLYLIGSSILKSRRDYAGITVNTGTALEISGEGSLEARGGEFGAGIGSDNNTSSGIITISGGTITAIGGKGAAGIGGGYQSDNDTVVIKGGYVNAKGGYTTNLGGAGIGGGGGDGSNNSGAGGVITITGGVVNAIGTDKGAGIGGGGDFNTAGTINIQDGIVFTQKGSNAIDDIGNGENGSGGSLSIEGNSAVFLKNGLSLAPATTTHTLVTASAITDHTAFGYSIPETWTAPIYAYIKNQTCNLIYSVNGGLGTAPDKVTQNLNTTAIVAGGNGLTNGTGIFKCWNTKADGTGTDYEPRSTFIFTEDDILYAIYYTPVHVASVTLSKAPEAMEAGETITLKATVLPENATSPEVKWTSSNEAVATVDNIGKVTALSTGKTTITATADGISDTCDINVKYAITFDLQSRGDSYIVNVDPDGDKKVPVQSDPLCTGYTFVGWYKEMSGINEWIFDKDTVNGDITLYAVWKKDGIQFSGSGTETNPFRITSAADLAQLATLVNAGDNTYSNSYYIQTRDIDLSGYSNWTPIGTSTSIFKGVYNGNNKSIINLSITALSTQYVGLFGYVNGDIRNLIIGSGDISITDDSSLYVGGIAGYLTSGTIENCTNASGIEVGDSLSNNKYAGGIVGKAIGNANINACINNGNLDVYGDIVDIGGIAGLIDKGIDISKCANYGYINSHAFDKINGGGILGSSLFESNHDNKSTIIQCFNTGNINNACIYSSLELGGIVGYSGSADITDCFNTGNINTDATSHGDGGGIAGRAEDYLIKNCYNMGYMNCYGSKGGIAGAFYGVFNNNYYADTCPTDIAIGNHYVNGMNIEQMKQKSTYSGFDFDTVWTMDESDKTIYEYPQLREDLIKIEKHNVSIAAGGEQGSVEGEGSYDLFDTVTIEAKPNTGYTFTQWTVVSGGVVISSSTSATASFSMPLSDVSITATFEKTKYNVTMQNIGYGTAAGSGSYAWGDTVSLNVTANSGYEFMYWKVKYGEATIADTLAPSVSFTMPQSDVMIEAYFDANPTSEYEYSISEGKATINKYIGNEANITIPYKLGGYRVTAIGDKAFKLCNMTKVTIPYTVETIASGIFYACNNLTEIVVDKNDSNFKSIDNVLFNAAGTRLIAYPSGKLGSYSIPQGVIDIDDYAFCSRSLITGICIPDSVVSIGCGAFEACTSINSLTIPDSVTSIGDDAFNCCSGVSKLVISNSLKTIGSYAFGSCTRLSQVTIPDSVISIGDYAFSGCSNISSFRLGNSVSSIGNYALSGLYIARIDMPKSLSSMGDYVFKDCTVLRSVYFWGPKPVFSTYAFNNLTYYATIYYHVKNISSWSLYSGARAFCMFTKDLKDGQPPSTNIVYLNSSEIPGIAAPYWNDHTFENWYKDSSCSSKWENESFFDDFTLYAKWSPGPYMITVGSCDHLYGDVTGGGAYKAISMVQFHAIPEDGCRFVSWFINNTMVSDDPDYSFIAKESDSYTAVFDKINTPKINSVIFNGNLSLQVTWDPVPGVTGYELLRSASKDGSYIKIATLSGTSYSDTELSMNSTYYYKVNAYYSTDIKTTRSDESVCVSGKTAPAAPEMVTAISMGYKSIKISWDQVSGASGYQIFRSTAKSGTYSFLYSTMSTSYLDGNLKTGTCYYYKVNANNNAVSSELSEAVFSVPVPSSVTGIKTTISSAAGVKLSWNKQVGSNGYEIWRSTSPDIGYLKISSAKSTSYSNTGIIPNTTYYYKVRAFCKVGKNYVPGDYSEPSILNMVLPKVTGVIGTIYKIKSVKLHWNSIKGVKGYEIWRSLSPDSGFAYISSTRGTKYTDLKLTHNIAYYYRIRAYVIINGVRYYSNEDSDNVSIKLIAV